MMLLYSLRQRPQVLWDLALDVGFWVFFTWKLCSYKCYFYVAFGNMSTIVMVGLLQFGVLGTLNMLGLAKRIGARFLLTSTSEVYGDSLEHPQQDSYWRHVNPIGEILKQEYTRETKRIHQNEEKSSVMVLAHGQKLCFQAMSTFTSVVKVRVFEWMYLETFE